MLPSLNARTAIARDVAASRSSAALGVILGVLACGTGSPASVAAQAAGPQGLEEIVVTSSRIAQSRRQLGTAVSAIDSSELELRGYYDLADVLRTQPGIGVSNSGGSGKATTLRIRGEESFRTMLIIDGVKAVDPSAPQVAPSFDSLLTTSDLERVEVLRGPQGFIYGADAGGVVNVITKRGADALGGQLGLEYGGLSTRRIDAAVSGGGDAGDYYVSVTDLETDGFNSRADDTVLRDADGASNTTLHAKLGWSATDNLRLQLVARDIDADADYDGCGFPTVHDCRVTTEQTTYKLSADHAIGDLTNSFGYSNVDIVRDNFAAGAPAFGSDGSLDRLEYTGSFRPTEAFSLVYGVDLQQERVDSSDDTTFRRDQKAYYVEYQGGFADALYLSVGARHDANDDFGSFTSTRLSLAYVQDLDASRSIKYRASLGTGFRAPSLFEIAYNAGPFAFPPAAGLALREEMSQGYDLGVEYHVANGLEFEVTYFDQDVEDEIYFDLVSFSGYLQSGGASHSKGVELGARIPFGQGLELTANWTRNDAETATNEQRLRRPKNLGNLGVLYRSVDGRFKFAANYRLAKGAVDARGGVETPLEDYAVLDLSAIYALTERLDLYARVQNATDEDYQEVLDYNVADRRAYGGVRLRF